MKYEEYLEWIPLRLIHGQFETMYEPERNPRRANLKSQMTDSSSFILPPSSLPLSAVAYLFFFKAHCPHSLLLCATTEPNLFWYSAEVMKEQTMPL